MALGLIKKLRKVLRGLFKANDAFDAGKQLYLAFLSPVYVEFLS